MASKPLLTAFPPTPLLTEFTNSIATRDTPGEVLDAFGPIGGYNFAWGWATGRAAGSAAGTGME